MHNRNTRSRRASAILLGLLMCADVSNATPADGALQKAADAIVEAALEAGPYPGISVGIARHGEVVYAKGFGFADLERRVPVTPEIRFPVGSITKSFTCLSLMQLVQAGAVDLDATAGTYLPALPEPSRSAKVRNLLNHTSGIPNYTELPEFPMGKPVGITREQMLGYFAGKPLQFDSGTRFSYSNSGTYLLGLIIEARSGESYDAYVTNHVLKPFAMTRSGFDARDDGAANRARGYQLTKDGFAPATAYDFEVPFSAGALVSTTGDLLRYQRGALGPNANADLRKRILAQDALTNGQPNPYALGCLIETRLDGHRKITHAGDIFGFAADYAYYPDDDLTIAILTNNQSAAFPPITIEHKLARVFLDLPEPKRVDLDVPTSLGNTIAGNYNVGAFRFGVDTLGFVFANGRVVLRLGGVESGAESLPLRYQGDATFVSAVDDEHLFVFEDGAGGATKLSMHYYEGVIDATKAGR